MKQRQQQTGPIAFAGFSLLLLGVMLSQAVGTVLAQAGFSPIGVIQGSGDVSPYRSERVSLRGVVTGIQEDINTRGIVYYTVFVQDLPGSEDGDPATSDGIAVFFGRNRPQIPLGSIVNVSGEVTEFYGFTEIDDDNLQVTTVRTDGIIPAGAAIEPPADLDEQRAYFEPLEGMRVRLDGSARVVGPAHEGCGFAVVAATDPPEPVLRRQLDDPTGRVIPVLYPTDVDCSDMPQVKTGDLIDGLSGVLIYNFDEFKILLAEPDGLLITESELAPLTPIPALTGQQLSAVTINVHDWFDSESLSGNPDEPVLLPEALAAKEAKLADSLANLLHCPTLIAIQEVEHEALLVDLASELAPACGFTYAVSHAESADARGIDNGLLSDPRRVTVHRVVPQQMCSPVPTDHEDAAIDCDAGTYVLFDRPPLQVDMTIDGRPAVAFVNHFKSKREGEAETALERLAQARFQNALAADLLAVDPDLQILVMGDLNDYELSATLLTLTDAAQGGQLHNALAAIPETERYSFIFGGVAGLLDAILVSPALDEMIQDTGVLHVNADYPAAWAAEMGDELRPYRFSDHDVPWIIWQQGETAAPTATPAPTVTSRPPTEIPPTAEILPSVTPEQVSALVPTLSPAAVSTPAAAPAAPQSLWPWLIGALAVAAIGAFLVLRLRR